MSEPLIPPPTEEDKEWPLLEMYHCVTEGEMPSFLEPHLAAAIIRRCHTAEQRAAAVEFELTDAKKLAEARNAIAREWQAEHAKVNAALAALQAKIKDARRAWLFKSPSGNYHLFDDEQFANAGDCYRVALVPIEEEPNE